MIEDFYVIKRVKDLSLGCYIFYGMKYWFLFFVVFVLASEVAASGMLVYGHAYVGGEVVPAGIVVTAMVVDSVVGNCSVGEGGLYSVFVSTSRGEYSPVEFYVDGGRAVQVVPFVDYSVMEIDLDFDLVESTTTSTTLAEPPVVTGRAVSVTISDTALDFVIVVLLAVIAYSIRDMLFVK